MARGDRIPCFLVEPTGRTVRSLRRFVFGAVTSGHCPHGYHDAYATLDTVDGRHAGPWDARLVPFDDPRWPGKCAHCAYTFGDEDQRQIFSGDEYRRTDTGALSTLSHMPAGAMWFAPWYVEDEDFYAGPEHLARRRGQPPLILKTPKGDWNIDGKSSSGGGWTRTGTAPAIVARPSIGINKVGGGFAFHGFLGGSNGHEPGVLEDLGE